MKSFLEVLDPQGFASQFNTVRAVELPPIPEIPAPALDAWARPDALDTIYMNNEAIEEVRDSALLAEVDGPFRPMNYRHD